MTVIQERDTNNVVLVNYTRGKDLSGSFQGAGGIGGLLARTDYTQTNSLLKTAIYHVDGNGNVTALVSPSGIILAWYLYDPYGKTLAQSGPLAIANTYRFSSKMWCEASGLYYYGYRFYSPNLQRWVNRDPIQEAGGVNLYEFVENDPTTEADLLGMASVPMPPNPPIGASCKAILEFLKQLTRHVRGRYNDLLADKLFLYKTDPVGWRNHLDEFVRQQQRLDKWIDTFKKLCPGGGGGPQVPPWVCVEAYRDVPTRPLWAERNTFKWGDYIPGSPAALETAATVSLVVAGVAIAATGVGAIIEAGGAGAIVAEETIVVEGGTSLAPVFEGGASVAPAFELYL
jgi:RHS repeat-associated protein